ncbi:LLM class F420-dependent oxidoreductase [Amycolatopsis australiensis]|uniref:Probable F420-dependent oxidoreductase, MSMEG_4141 family n=1 Tax=Amycolatopsis australiensis TaxID=546364 RepID=A0A1K1Q820_9PSEU|nr:LLM class F420-dependent oxidoreductase [Amycolatopsis australiensis]SFW56106.1 probable F420-dependent oxidoreductase, MSMEG_4141 family [Amycolatopsis australiensis]
MAIELGKLGIWRQYPDVDAKFAADAEKLGYGAIWLGSSPGGDLAYVDDLLGATESLVVATGIVNIWQDEPASIAKAYERIAGKYPDRFLLGVGAGHREHTQEFKKPYTALVEYLDGLDAAGVPVAGRALAALGPKVVKLAGDRTAGAHPYLVTPEHTREARQILGPGKLLAPEHKVVLGTDAAEARAIGRRTVKFYLGLVNYVSNLRKLGFTDEDLAGEGSDRLVDALALHGDAETIATGLRAHFEAGADQVIVQVLNEDPWPAYRELAAALR